MATPSTKAAIVSIVGASIYGFRRWREQQEQLNQMDTTGETYPTISEPLIDEDVPFSRSVIGQTMCATFAGWFQVYSGGIMIDTVATRLQAGVAPGPALWGVGLPSTNVSTLAKRYSSLSGSSLFATRCTMLLRSNLCAGHFVTMLSRFPYLFLNFNAYAQTEQALLRTNVLSLGAQRSLGRQKNLVEEFVCVSIATIISTAAITAAECPKILDQLHSGKCKAGIANRSTVVGVVRDHGVARLMRGYTATFCREFLFNTALLGTPSLARYLKETYNPRGQAGGEAQTLWSRCLDGNEVIAAALILGLPLGFITNAPDQLKTNIQKGQFLNMREALVAQQYMPNGILGLFGRAAVYRALYIVHAVVMMNWARVRVEDLIDSYNFEEFSFGD